MSKFTSDNGRIYGEYQFVSYKPSVCVGRCTNSEVEFQKSVSVSFQLLGGFSKLSSDAICAIRSHLALYSDVTQLLYAVMSVLWNCFWGECYFMSKRGNLYVSGCNDGNTLFKFTLKEDRCRLLLINIHPVSRMFCCSLDMTHTLPQRELDIFSVFHRAMKPKLLGSNTIVPILKNWDDREKETVSSACRCILHGGLRTFLNTISDNRVSSLQENCSPRMKVNVRKL